VTRFRRRQRRRDVSRDADLRAVERLHHGKANANPNLTKDEDLAESAKTVGVGYDALLMRIVNLGLSYMPEWRMFEP